jgi:acetyl-CoA acetyltransferase
MKNISDQIAIAGVGVSEFGQRLPDSPLGLAAKAFKAALADSGLARDDVDGIATNIGWPLGTDYDRLAEVLGLRTRYVSQMWTHGRFVTSSLQHAAMAVATGMADCVACICSLNFSRVRDLLGGHGDTEGTREDGGSHGENPVYGMTAPAAGAAMAMRRYMETYCVPPEYLAAVPMAFRKHAQLNPRAVMNKPLTLDDYSKARWIVDPLRLYDCALVSDGAACLLVVSAERAKDLASKPVFLSGMQGLRAGREEFIFAPPGLGINQQTVGHGPLDADLTAYRMAGVSQADIDGLYTYDAFSPLPLFTLERFGFCGRGEAADWVQGGRIELGGELPMNTSGGLLSEAHVSGWNSIVEIVRQLRGECGPRQVVGAQFMQWATVWGDSIIFRR